jgi:tRNA A-37 threonylcarbamoyl transferase component Bud32
MDALLAGRYRLIDRVGAGGMGEVWRATDQLLGRTVAVKVMRAELLQQAGFAERFLAEARSMATIKHPGVVTVHDYHGDSGGAFLVMEFVPGEPLSHLLQRSGRLDPTHAMTLLAQAADALQAAHDQRVVHRDVKPGNLLITADGTVVLTDFGIARSAAGTAVTASGMVIGTPAYLAPEQVTGQPVTARTDVYALGVVAYECLTGRRPFEGDNPFGVAARRLREPPPTMAGHLPAAVVAVVERALALDPAQRWPSAAAMAQAMRQAAADRPTAISAAAPSPAALAARPPSVSVANLLLRVSALGLGGSLAMLVATVPDAVRVSRVVLGEGWATSVRLLEVVSWTTAAGYGLAALLLLLLAWQNDRGSRVARGWTIALGALITLGLAPLGIGSGAVLAAIGPSTPYREALLDTVPPAYPPVMVLTGLAAVATLLAGLVLLTLRPANRFFAGG